MPGIEPATVSSSQRCSTCQFEIVVSVWFGFEYVLTEKWLKMVFLSLRLNMELKRAVVEVGLRLGRL